MRSFQFSLRSLMVIVALAAIWISFWAAKPSWQCGLIQIPVFVAVPTTIAVFASRATGYARTFYLATLVIMLMTAISQCQYFYSYASALYSPYSSSTSFSGILFGFAQQKNATLLFLWPVAFIAGAIAALTHRLLTPAKRSSSQCPTQELLNDPPDRSP